MRIICINTAARLPGKQVYITNNFTATTSGSGQDKVWQYTPSSTDIPNLDYICAIVIMSGAFIMAYAYNTIIQYTIYAVSFEGSTGGDPMVGLPGSTTVTSGTYITNTYTFTINQRLKTSTGLGLTPVIGIYFAK